MRAGPQTREGVVRRENKGKWGWGWGGVGVYFFLFCFGLLLRVGNFLACTRDTTKVRGRLHRPVAFEGVCGVSGMGMGRGGMREREVKWFGRSTEGCAENSGEKVGEGEAVGFHKGGPGRRVPLYNISYRRRECCAGWFYSWVCLGCCCGFVGEKGEGVVHK